MLRLSKVSTWYGRIQALRGVSLRVDRGEIVVLIGSNGAGKTTLLMTVCGVTPPRAGKVFFKDEDVTGSAPHRCVKAGISIAPEGRRIFDRLTVRENLELAAVSSGSRVRMAENLDFAMDLFPVLKRCVDQKGGTLSGGEQQMLAISRAMMCDPELLLLDEPSLGLAPMIVTRIFEVIAALNKERGITVLLVEQNARMALKLADRGYVLMNGSVVKEGTGKRLIDDPEVKAAYLGGGG